MSIFVKSQPFSRSSIKVQGLPLEAVKHALMKDGEDPSIVDPDYGKFAKEQETKGRRHSQKDLDAERFTATV